MQTSTQMAVMTSPAVSGGGLAATMPDRTPTSSRACTTTADSPQCPVKHWMTIKRASVGRVVPEGALPWGTRWISPCLMEATT